MSLNSWHSLSAYLVLTVLQREGPVRVAPRCQITVQVPCCLVAPTKEFEAGDHGKASSAAAGHYLQYAMSVLILLRARAMLIVAHSSQAPTYDTYSPGDSITQRHPSLKFLLRAARTTTLPSLPYNIYIESG
ncbi:hypothetical protein DEU56DRAFT_754161 [Suillus clintonianus]|uniref:uncharacterized protein n=1 Tax=Suillus clintonianus TaxID=1904413 RepID=UPI001B86C6A2|nr:uncharacterized protein DEU56DRAFT_754161 [Suillus clintonianus]KAG2144488.1 hypothetical protein DEU56DRAFT_754161 [Suillus clintonianus]